MADDPKKLIHHGVYFQAGGCSCRACGLEWRSHVLQPCPRCNEASLHSEAVKLQESMDTMEKKLAKAMALGRVLLAMVIKIGGIFGVTPGDSDVLDQYIELFDPDRKPKRDDPTVPQQHPDNGGLT